MKPILTQIFCNGVRRCCWKGAVSTINISIGHKYWWSKIQTFYQLDHFRILYWGKTWALKLLLRSLYKSSILEKTTGLLVAQLAFQILLWGYMTALQISTLNSTSDCFPSSFQWSSISIQYANVQQQKNGYDCGLFSIAYAMAICNRQESEGLQFDTTVMRWHLYDCLEDQLMKHFPSKVRKYAKMIRCEEKEQFFCHCC